MVKEFNRRDRTCFWSGRNSLVVKALEEAGPLPPTGEERAPSTPSAGQQAPEHMTQAQQLDTPPGLGILSE